jgi:hypothetical protein
MPNRFLVVKNLKQVIVKECITDPSVSENLQSLNFFESDLGLVAAINDDTWATQYCLKPGLVTDRAFYFCSTFVGNGYYPGHSGIANG